MICTVMYTLVCSLMSYPARLLTILYIPVLIPSMYMYYATLKIWEWWQVTNGKIYDMRVMVWLSI